MESYLIAVRKVLAQPDILNTSCFLRFLLWLQLLGDQVGVATAIAKAGNAIFQVAQDGVQNIILPHTKVSLPSLLIK